MKPRAARTPKPNASEKRPERFRAKLAKKQMIEYLEKYPVVEAACSKVGISRSTHYKWYNEDFEYRAQLEMALQTSIGTVNDVAESNIINKVKGGDMKATQYWLEHHHHAYAKKLSPTIQKLVMKPKPSPEFVASVQKYDPDYTPATDDIYMTEEEWLRERKDAERVSRVIAERSRIKFPRHADDDP